ncbi:unnamed protein product, partial [Mesorhabditis spiculigera]
MNSPPVTPKSRRQSGTHEKHQDQHVIHLPPDARAITLNMQLPRPTLRDVLNNYLPSTERMPNQYTKTITIPASATQVKLIFETPDSQQDEQAGSTKRTRRSSCGHDEEHFSNVPTKSLRHPGKEYVRADIVGKARNTLKAGEMVLVLTRNSRGATKWREGRAAPMGSRGAVPIEYWRQGDDGQWGWKQYAGQHGALIACPHHTLYVFPPDHAPSATSSKLIP